MSKIYTFNNKIVTINNKWAQAVEETPPSPPVIPYNPLGLPSNTIRVRTNDGNVPKKVSYGATYETATLVTGTTDVYDVYKSGTDFTRCLLAASNVVAILGANLIDVTKIDSMFMNCNYVESGALALYQQESGRSNPPTSHSGTFTWCGKNTTSGAAELAQIPESWGGTGA